MEIYQAIADFVPPVDQSNRNILSFLKNDTFEIFHRGKLTDWWGARALKNNVTGYVPAKYMKYVEKLVGKQLPENYSEEKEKKIKHFEDMQNSFYPNHPQNINIPEPAPDYNEDEGDFFPPPPAPISVDDHGNINSLESKLNGNPPPAVMKQPPDDECVQIQPKKLGNPCLQSAERQAVHQQLLFYYKRGVNVLQKPELSKILEKRKETQRHKEWKEQHTNKRTSLELKLEERANKMKEEETKHMKSISEKTENTPEYLKMHAKITQKSPDN